MHDVRSPLGLNRSLVLVLVCLATAAAAADPATTGVAPLDAALHGVADEGARTPLGRDLLALSGEGQGLAQALSQTTELAISPLLALTAMSAWRWFRTDAAGRAALPFFMQPWFWGAAVALLMLILFKEVVIARIPGAKKPLDALQLVENKVSGLVASPIAIGALAWALERALQGVDAQQLTGLFWGTAWAGDGVAVGSRLPEALTWTFSIVGATAIYGSLWLASHTINVLILLSPFGLVDNALKLLRLGLLATVGLLGHWMPTVGAVLCVLLAVGALASAPFSWRLMRFGLSFALGLLRAPAELTRTGRVFAFSGPTVPLPVRTCGWLEARDGELAFHYRRAFLLPRRLVLDAGPLCVERGVLHPVLLDGSGRLAFRLTPYVRGREADVALALGGLGVVEQPVMRGLRGLGAWLRGALDGDLATDLDVR